MAYDYQTPPPRRETSKLRRFAGQIGRGLLIGGGILGALGVLGTLANSRYNYAERGIETGSESLHSDNPQKDDAHQVSEQISVPPTRKVNIRTRVNQLVDEVRGAQPVSTDIGSDTGLSGTGTLLYSPTEANEPGSTAVRRSELTPDMRLKAQFYDKPYKTEDDPSTWTEGKHGYSWNLATDDYMNPGESREEYSARNRAKAQLGEFIADRMLGTQENVVIKRGPTIEDGIAYGEDHRGELQGKQSMGGLVNVVLDETHKGPDKLYKFAREQLIKSADPGLHSERLKYEGPEMEGKRKTDEAKSWKRSIEAREKTYIPKHGRGSRTSQPPIDRATKLVGMTGWDEDEVSGGNPDHAVRMAEGYKKAKEAGLIPDDVQLD